MKLELSEEYERKLESIIESYKEHFDTDYTVDGLISAAIFDMVKKHEESIMSGGLTAPFTPIAGDDGSGPSTGPGSVGGCKGGVCTRVPDGGW